MMSNGNSSKSQVFLMEFICVILFFALCAALCLNVFVKADGMSRKGQEINEALVLAQSMAESIKVMESPSHEFISAEAEQISNGKYMVKAKDSVQDDILQVNIHVYHDEDSKEKICTLTVKKYLPGEV